MTELTHDILVVDDEEDIRMLIAGVLKDEGYSTREAGDSEREIHQRRPSLVILDIWLQGSELDGLEILNVLREEYQEIPVIMISGHGNVETAVAAIKRGAYDYIEKPFKTDRLLHLARTGDRSRPAAPGKSGFAATRRWRYRNGGKLTSHAPGACRDHPCCADRQPGADQRSRRGGEGSRGPPHPC
jgi:DNA-binding NtrC family response regulator